MSNKICKWLSAAFVFCMITFRAGAEQVKTYIFTGVNTTEKVQVRLNEDGGTIKYFSLGGTTEYSIVDYDYTDNSVDGTETLSCTVQDALYDRKYDVLVTYNAKYSDIRINHKRIVFSYVSRYEVEM